MLFFIFANKKPPCICRAVSSFFKLFAIVAIVAIAIDFKFEKLVAIRAADASFFKNISVNADNLAAAGAFNVVVFFFVITAATAIAVVIIAAIAIIEFFVNEAFKLVKILVNCIKLFADEIHTIFKISYCESKLVKNINHSVDDFGFGLCCIESKTFCETLKICNLFCYGHFFVLQKIYFRQGGYLSLC